MATIERNKPYIIQILKSFMIPLIAITALSNVKCEPEGNIIGAISHMIPLVEIERRLVHIARDYLKEERKRLSELAPFAKSVEEAMELSKEDPEKYLGNPINCYLIIKRFTSGWKELSSRLKTDTSRVRDIEDLLLANEMYLPTDAIDMIGATNAMIRLMDSYGITARQLSDGDIDDLVPAQHQLTAEDCLEIADVAHVSRRYVRMKEWLDEAERLISDPTTSHRHGNTTRSSVYEFLSWAHYLSNNLTEALRYTQLVLKDHPNHEKALNNQEFFNFYQKENVENWLTGEQWDYREDKRSLDIFRNGRFVKACENRIKLVKVKNIWNLVSYYKQDKPRLILKPAKITCLHDNPEVYIFHDMLGEKEMTELKTIADPRLTTAEVMDPFKDTRITADYRVAKTMFLQKAFPRDRAITKQLHPVFSDVTDLDMTHSEAIQINNYGLGGQYEFHQDWGEKGTTIEASPDGNRIATLLMYISDVALGGDTVFTELGLSVAPKKGSAVFWYNLYRNGTGIYDTKHASCPVMSGSKWVSNQWVRIAGNEFRRRCSLNQFE